MIENIVTAYQQAAQSRAAFRDKELELQQAAKDNISYFQTKMREQLGSLFTKHNSEIPKEIAEYMGWEYLFNDNITASTYVHGAGDYDSLLLTYYDNQTEWNTPIINFDLSKINDAEYIDSTIRDWASQQFTKLKGCCDTTAEQIKQRTHEALIASLALAKMLEL